MKILKRIDCLLKYFDNRNSTNIFYCLFIHVLQCCHISFHKMGIIPAHHLFQEENTDSHRNQTTDSQPPVKNKNQYQYSNRHHNRPCQIWKLMCQKILCESCIIIYDFSQTSACILAKIPKRQCHYMMYRCLFHIGGCTKCSKMRTTKCDKIQKNT